ncbi:peptidoglycan-binding protein [Sphingomonas segetis]|uniref:peptidoglycan-binding protein n=1 Tax=Sphingomonas segetis TaxID=1104779 RepID=UPI0018AD556C|nr:peptidoglycan-binding protein [Sphingomonas segetis]
MSSFSPLQRGDRLPTVGVIQLLLNRAGGSLRVDGSFGPRTQAAVLDFQHQRRLPPTGMIDALTWNRLFHADKPILIDLIDVFDERIYQKQAQEMESTGSSPIYMGGMSNGLAQMAEKLRGASQIMLLRIVGHGASGVQAISMGVGGWVETVGSKEVRHFYPHQTTSMSASNVATLPPSLRGIFGSWGNLELHGCHVAQGPQGREFVRKLADVVGVPVTAGKGTQRSGLRFLGSTFTAAPDGRTLEEWCAGLPQFTPVSVP